MEPKHMEICLMKFYLPRNRIIIYLSNNTYNQEFNLRNEAISYVPYYFPLLLPVLLLFSQELGLRDN